MEKPESISYELWSLSEMEPISGEPVVVRFDEQSGEFIFYDCSPESPKGSMNSCYDYAAWESRQEHKPEVSAVELAAAMGINILKEEEYRELQKLGEFDLKMSSWVETPPGIRNLSGAIFCDRRFSCVFTFHIGAESYYAARAFRGLLRV